MKHETLHHESIPENSHNLKAAQRREAPLILSQSPCLHVLQFQQQPDGKPRNGKGRCPGTCRDLAALTQLLWPPSPSLPCHSARQWAWKVTWLQQQACCGGCWCLIWLAAGSWGIWGEADRRLRLTSSEISSKEEPGRSSGDGEGAECLMRVPTCECVMGCLLVCWDWASHMRASLSLYFQQRLSGPNAAGLGQDA